MDSQKTIEKPEDWESNLTEFDLRGMDEFQRRVLNQMNVLEQQFKSLATAVERFHIRDLERETRLSDLNNRIIPFEQTKANLWAQWKLVACAAAVSAWFGAMFSHAKDVKDFFFGK